MYHLQFMYMLVQCVQRVSLPPLACWDCGFESQCGSGILRVVFSGYRPLPRADPFSRVVLPISCVLLSVVRCSSNPFHLQLLVINVQINKERKKEKHLNQDSH